MLRSIKKIILVTCALIVLVTFALHTVQINHPHYGATHAHADSAQTDHVHSGVDTDPTEESLSSKLHMADKKMFYVMLTLMVLFVALVQPRTLSFDNIVRVILVRLTDLQRRYVPRAHSHMSLLYRTGILNPKLF